MGFVALGAVAGGVTAILSLTPIWLGLTQLPRDFIGSWSLAFIAVVGAGLGAVVMPILGWLVIGRLTFWRAVITLSIGAVLGEHIAAILFSSLQTDVLIIGAFLGALATALGVRVVLSTRQASPPAT